MIKIRKVSRQHLSGKSTVVALQDIDLEINAGEFLAIVGPSGSGKTTLLNLIGGLDTASEGSIEINGKNISSYNDKELSKYRNHSIGFIFQEFHLEPFLTVKDNVLLPTFFNHHDIGDDNRAEKLLEEVEIRNKSESKVNELSGGQKQRTAIARALINNPKILLADEPTGNLDIKTGKIIIDLLIALHKKHKTTLIIATHDEKIAKAAQRIIKITDGKIIK